MRINEYRVKPKLPEVLEPLNKIAGNYWYCWNKPAVDLFKRLNPVLWDRVKQNPVQFLGNINQDVLNSAAADEGFVAELERVYDTFKEYFSRSTWFGEEYGSEKNFQVAYFSCEYGIDVSLMIYSGGLGILAGDHLKSASDLGIPIVGVGMMYQKATFHQYITHDGWQQEYYTRNDWYNMPVTRVKNDNGGDLIVDIPLNSDRIHAAVWELYVGKVKLFLLDTNIPENIPEYREITGELYPGDRELRLRQELVLGVGGVKALEAMGIKPTVYHINEGHSAFLLLERVRSLMVGKNLNFNEAKEIVRASTVFTTHTPVPAGNEYFQEPAILEHLHPLRVELGLSEEELLSLGRFEEDVNGNFCMTVLALKLSSYNNGVSKLHGKVSRRMWKNLWPELPEEEIPIVSITNGIHTLSWISHELTDLFIRYLGPGFFKKPADKEIWKRVSKIPDAELWRIHQIRKDGLITFCRKRLRNKLIRQGAGASEIQTAEEVLKTDCLTIGFARRFAEYKRASLIFRDKDRLIKILTNPDRPVQIIIAGKAHPMDNKGKELIKSIIHFINDNNLDNHIVFLDDYDIDVARSLVQGVDVWLNTPKMEMEASGTSGMKAAANGGLNLSIPDGWWNEAYTRDTGWSIGNGEIYSDPDEQDYVESEALYNILEREVIPLYYTRDRVGLPREWIRMMKESMKILGSYFNTHRMLRDYTEHFYMQAHRKGLRLLENGASGARELVQWETKIRSKWDAVKIMTEKYDSPGVLRSGEKVNVTVLADLAGLEPDDVAVELLYGKLNQFGKIQNGRVTEMEFLERSGSYDRFVAAIPCTYSGRHGFSVRIRPDHPLMTSRFYPYLLKWEE